VNTWPTAWRERTLTHLSVPVTQHALDVLRDWERSTPTQPWTNNPLGLPAVGNGVPEALGTPYGAFPHHDSFRTALKRIADDGGHMPLVHALLEGTSVSRAWRTINGLGLPGSSTESDYPAVLLDRVSDRYRSKIQTVDATRRKSMGSGPGPVDMSHPVLQAASGIHHAANNIHDLNQAIRYLTQRTQ
jgi:hypothetical protein